MFCKNCGKEIDERAYVCPHCGVKVKDEESERRAANAAADNGSKTGWGILSFFIPLVGLILYCMWKDERPQTARVCGKCALISFIIGIVFSILYVIVGAIFVRSLLHAVFSLTLI